MRKTIEIDIHPTPSEMEAELWEKCDAAEQARFLNDIAKRYKNETAAVLYQINAIAIVFNKAYIDETRRYLLLFLEELIDYIKGGDYIRDGGQNKKTDM